MLSEKNPCEGCIINVICEQICPKAFEYYSKRVRIRSKSEVEQATGYYWEDDYIDSDTGEIFNYGGVTSKIEKPKPVKKESNIAMKIIKSWIR